jgi:rubrerythrin
MSLLPAHLPQDVQGASAYIYTVETPTSDDLKVMVYLEAAGQGFYSAFADAAPNDEVRAIMSRNGQEEVGHAHRVSRVLKMVFDEDFAVPEPAENPYYAKPEGMTITPDLLNGIAAGEIAGDALYEKWAANLGHDDAARLLRQNGKEEKGHGERMQRAAALL